MPRTMDRFSHFSYMAPAGHFSLSIQDRVALANTITPGERNQSTFTLGLTDPATLEESARRSAQTDQTDDRKSSVVQFKPGLRFHMAFAALAALSLVTALDGTSISVALPVIADALGGNAVEAFWAGTSFLLCYTVFQPIYASFSHIFGRKYATLVATALFMIGTVVCGVAPTMTILLVGRSIQGIGGGGIVALTNILITDLVPLRQRGSWMGVLGAMWAFGSVTGPVVGGSLAHPSLWQWIFWLNLPFIAISFLMVAFFIRLKEVPTSLASKCQRADWLGSVIFVGSVTAMLVPLTWAGVMYVK